MKRILLLVALFASRALMGQLGAYPSAATLGAGAAVAVSDATTFK
jgi:hypothetical protein